MSEGTRTLKKEAAVWKIAILRQNLFHGAILATAGPPDALKCWHW